MHSMYNVVVVTVVVEINFNSISILKYVRLTLTDSSLVARGTDARVAGVVGLTAALVETRTALARREHCPGHTTSVRRRSFTATFTATFTTTFTATFTATFTKNRTGSYHLHFRYLDVC